MDFGETLAEAMTNPYAVLIAALYRDAERYRALESIMDGIPGQRAIAKRVSARVMGYEVTYFGETVRAKTLQSLADAIIEQQAEQEKPLTPAPPDPR